MKGLLFVFVIGIALSVGAANVCLSDRLLTPDVLFSKTTAEAADRATTDFTQSPDPAMESTWELSFDLPSPETEISFMRIYNDKLYISTFGSGTLYEFDGSNWRLAVQSGEIHLFTMAVYRGKLYVGSTIPQGPGNATIYVYDGSTWSVSYRTDRTVLRSAAVYQDKLYVAASEGGIFVYDGQEWALAYTLSNPSEMLPSAMGVYQGKLYVGGEYSGRFWTYDGSSWTEPGNKYPSGYYGAINDLKVYNGKLYASAGGKVLMFDGSSWERVFDTQLTYAIGMATYNGKLYVGAGNDIGERGAKVFVYDGLEWKVSFAKEDETSFFSLGEYKGKLYAGSYPNALVYVHSEPPIVSASIKPDRDRYRFNSDLRVSAIAQGSDAVAGAKWAIEEMSLSVTIVSPSGKPVATIPMTLDPDSCGETPGTVQCKFVGTASYRTVGDRGTYAVEGASHANVEMPNAQFDVFLPDDYWGYLTIEDIVAGEGIYRYRDVSKVRDPRGEHDPSYPLYAFAVTYTIQPSPNSGFGIAQEFSYTVAVSTFDSVASAQTFLERRSTAKKMTDSEYRFPVNGRYYSYRIYRWHEEIEPGHHNRHYTWTSGRNLIDITVPNESAGPNGLLDSYLSKYGSDLT